MLYVSSLLTPTIIGAIVGILTHSWIWGLVSGFVTLSLSIMLFSFLAGLLLGYPNRYSRKWASVMHVTKRAYEPTKYEILNEILLKEGKNLISKHSKHPELLGRSAGVSINPFNQSDYEYLLSAFLGGPSRLGSFDTEKLEGTLKKLLQDDYDRYYDGAKKRIIDSNWK
jgi:hypothetical protein